MSRPVIGILGHIQGDPSAAFGIVCRNAVNVACVRSIERNKGVPIMLPVPERPELMDPVLGLCDGLLFPGGLDVDPRCYGEPPHKDIGPFIPEMDAFWLYAASYAMSRRIPMLGICRGMQLLNVACGGTLYQDLGERERESFLHVQSLRRETPTHRVLIKSGTHLFRILNAEAPYVNSMHHQAVKELGKGLILTAHAEDGVIEGIESPDGLIVAVQWHPEDLLETAPIMHNLFRDLAKRAAERQA